MGTDNRSKHNGEDAGLAAFDDLDPVSIVSELDLLSDWEPPDPRHPAAGQGRLRRPSYAGPPVGIPMELGGFDDEEQTRMFVPDEEESQDGPPSGDRAPYFYDPAENTGYITNPRSEQLRIHAATEDALLEWTEDLSEEDLELAQDWEGSQAAPAPTPAPIRQASPAALPREQGDWAAQYGALAGPLATGNPSPFAHRGQAPADYHPSSNVGAHQYEAARGAAAQGGAYPHHESVPVTVGYGGASIPPARTAPVGSHATLANGSGFGHDVMGQAQEGYRGLEVPASRRAYQPYGEAVAPYGAPGRESRPSRSNITDTLTGYRHASNLADGTYSREEVMARHASAPGQAGARGVAPGPESMGRPSRSAAAPNYEGYAPGPEAGQAGSAWPAYDQGGHGQPAPAMPVEYESYERAAHYQAQMAATHQRDYDYQGYQAGEGRGAYPQEERDAPPSVDYALHAEYEPPEEYEAQAAYEPVRYDQLDYADAELMDPNGPESMAGPGMHGYEEDPRDFSAEWRPAPELVGSSDRRLSSVQYREPEPSWAGRSQVAVPATQGYESFEPMRSAPMARPQAPTYGGAPGQGSRPATVSGGYGGFSGEAAGGSGGAPGYRMSSAPLAVVPAAPRLPAMDDPEPGTGRFGKRFVLMAVVLLAVAGAVVSAVLMWSGSAYQAKPATAPAVATLTTDPSDVEVLVDGVQLATRESPFTLELSPDQAHQVVVRKEGFKEATLPVALGAGSTVALETVRLEPLNLETGVIVDSNPQGARIVVDGNDTGSTTPARLTGMVDGMHAIRLVGATRGNAHEVHVYVTKGQMLKLPLAEMGGRGRGRGVPGVAGMGAGSANLGMGRATGGGAQVPRSGGLGDGASRQGGLRGGGDGFGESRGGARAADMDRDPASRRSSGDDDLLGGSASGAADMGDGAGPGSGGPTGTLRLNARPWAQVFVDGRKVGNTPLMNQEVPAGVRTIRLVNPELDMTKTLKIRVPPGQTVTKIVDLIE